MLRVSLLLLNVVNNVIAIIVQYDSYHDNILSLFPANASGVLGNPAALLGLPIGLPLASKYLIELLKYENGSSDFISEWNLDTLAKDPLDCF